MCQWGARVKNLASKCEFFVGTINGYPRYICCRYGLGTNPRASVRRRCFKNWTTYSSLIKIGITKEAAITDNSGWKKEGYLQEECAGVRYQKKKP